MVVDSDVVATVEEYDRLENVVWGRYRVVVERESGDDDVRTFTVSEWAHDATIFVRSDAIETEQPIEDPPSCPWNR